MLHRVDVGSKHLDRYGEIVGAESIAELRALAKPLRGCRIAHVNSTTYGGGVSELLRSLVPLYRSLEIKADWLVIPGSPEFFEVTKGFHNALQGAPFQLTEEAKAIYLRQNQQVASLLERQYDVVVVHDPQPAPLRALHGRNNARWVWRCHIDTSQPNPDVLSFLLPFLAEYDALVFTMPQFVPHELARRNIVIIPPAIDPLNPKNMTAPMDLCQQIIDWTGIDLTRSLITQTSRFDPWKDPIGVIEVYRRIRDEVPDVQLALLGQLALDDPDGWRMYHDIVAQTEEDDDIHVLTNFTGIGNMEVNAFQCCSNVVLQKSIREGFGLVVSETLWKGTPVVAGRAGGIPLQMPAGTGGYLIDSNDECVEKTVHLLRNPREGRKLGATGRVYVKEHFLITRLLADELRFLAPLL